MNVVGRCLANFMPGDSSHVDHFETEFSDENIDLVMLPIWVFAARYPHGGEQRTLRILINGQTGEIQGDLPRSIPKIVAGVVLGLLIIAIVVFAGMGLFGLGLISFGGGLA